MSGTIYSQIGGRETVEQVVEDFYERVLTDDELAGFFEGMEMATLRTHQVQFISAVAGGPVDYTGADMRSAHSHLDISEADFDAVESYLKRALHDAGVDEENVSAIMSEVVALKDPIVGD
jgi:hemoglobin